MLTETQKFQAILKWQSGGFHPLTCGTCEPPERDEFPLVPWLTHNHKVVLICPLGCYYVQSYIPDVVLAFGSE